MSNITNDATLDKQYQSKINRVRKYCPLGMTHFCDGSVNISRAKAGEKPVDKCEFYVDRVCTNANVHMRRGEI